MNRGRVQRAVQIRVSGQRELETVGDGIGGDDDDNGVRSIIERGTEGRIEWVVVWGMERTRGGTCVHSKTHKGMERGSTNGRERTREREGMSGQRAAVKYRRPGREKQ